MTNDQITSLAKQAGFNPVAFMGSNTELFQRFAQLVRNEVLEDAALACESLDEASGPCSWHYEIATQNCASAIRSMK